MSEAVPATQAWRWFIRAATALLVVYAIDVIAGKTAQVMGVALPFKFNDVGEFLVVLLAMMCFVTGILIQEAQQGTSEKQET